jgi:hypothetical protein
LKPKGALILTDANGKDFEIEVSRWEFVLQQNGCCLHKLQKRISWP